MNRKIGFNRLATLLRVNPNVLLLELTWTSIVFSLNVSPSFLRISLCLHVSASATSLLVYAWLSLPAPLLPPISVAIFRFQSIRVSFLSLSIYMSVFKYVSISMSVSIFFFTLSSVSMSILTSIIFVSLSISLPLHTSLPAPLSHFFHYLYHCIYFSCLFILSATDIDSVCHICVGQWGKQTYYRFKLTTN